MDTGKQLKKFSCVEGCSDCCTYRDYYPSVEYGKIGVLLLPEEKAVIERLADKIKVKIKIIPRLAVGREHPERVVAFQMMGKNSDGDLCPFLDFDEKSPHGGFSCKIYSERPLACRAYPIIDSGKTATLDNHCQFCKKHSTTSAANVGLEKEVEALSKIRSKVVAGKNNVWRYATATGKPGDTLLPEGWVAES